MNKKIFVSIMAIMMSMSLSSCTVEKKDLNSNQIETRIKNENYIAKESCQDIMNKIIEITNNKIPMTIAITKDKLDIFFTDEEGNPLLTQEYIEEFSGIIPMLQSASEVSIFKTKDGKVEEVKEAIEKRKELQMNTFKELLPDQYDIIKNSTLIVKGNYVIFISLEEDLMKEVNNIIEEEIIKE